MTFSSSNGRLHTALRYPITWALLILAALVVTLFALQLTGRTGTALRNLSALLVRPAQTYTTGELKGRKLCDLYAEYLGVRCGEPVPASLSINWDRNLVALWARKVRRSSGNPVVQEASAALVAEYLQDGRDQTTFVAYKARASAIANETWLALDWEKVGKVYFRKLPEPVANRKLTLLRHIAGQVRGRDLLAYGGAELMPSADGRLNRAFIGFILENAGAGWLERVPAEHDDMTSFGLFQFTSFALYDTAKERRGASKPNQALPASLRIPGSVLKLRGDDHFRAAYLFAVDNLAQFIRKLDARELATLERVWRHSDRDVAEFVALAHHSPGSAFSAGRRWLDHGASGEFAVSTSRVARLYATKAAKNYDAF